MTCTVVEKCISLRWMHFRHHHRGPCGDGFHTTRPRYKAQIQTTTALHSRAKENCIVFQSMLVALRGLPATGTLLIKRRQTAGAGSRGFLLTTTGEEEEEEEGWKQKEGTEERGRMIKH